MVKPVNNPTGGNFRNINLKESLSNDVAINPGEKGKSLAASSWLDQQKLVRFSQPSDQISFVMRIYDSPGVSLPPASELLVEINSRYLAFYPNTSTIRTNPKSQNYPGVLDEMKKLLKNHSGLKILYSSSNASYGNSGVAVLLADSHIDAEERVKHFDLLFDAYRSGFLALSPGFVEGKVDPAEAQASIPSGFTFDQVRASVHQYKLSAEQGVIYLLKNQKLSFAPESITPSEEMQILMNDLISMASGAYPTLFANNGYARAKHNLELVHRQSDEFYRKDSEYLFLVQFAITLRQQLDKLKFPEATKRTIANKASEILLNSLQGLKQQDYQSIRAAINSPQYAELRDFYLRERFELTVAKRNVAIAGAYKDAGTGTRPMIIGSGHIKTEMAGDYRLVKLLEEKNIPVIVISLQQNNFSCA